MLPEIGQFLMIMALSVAVAQSVIPLIGAQKGWNNWMKLAPQFAWAQLGLLLLAYVILTHGFITHDFSIAYVAQNSSLDLPLEYRISAVWGGHEGSLLLWVAILAGWGVAVAKFSSNLPMVMSTRVLAILGIVSVGFIGFMVFTSNPFDRMSMVPVDGNGMNPMLQDPGMIFHPPLLYMGYVGFAVTFAFAMAALIGGKLDAAWARWSRPWTTVSWVFLTFGIALGSWWAYDELGWGGWWFWDPVENASFMPWLTATALLHSLAVTEKRGAFRSWTVMLAILTFAVTILGAFLVRSGVITSVHAFATDPTRGVYILVFLALVVGISLAIYSWRAPKIGMGGNFTNWSRESLLLANNVLLVVAFAAVLLGTIYPMVLDALGMGKISVGPPYFDAVFAPLMMPLLFLMFIGPMVSWKQGRIRDTFQTLSPVIAVALLASIVWPLAMGQWGPMVAFSVFIATGIFATFVVDLYPRIKPRPQAGILLRLKSIKASWLGMHVAHIGLAIAVIGIAMVMGYEKEKDVRLAPGSSTELVGYEFKFIGVEEKNGPNYQSNYGTVEVLKQGKLYTTLHPEKRAYDTHKGMPMTQASLDRGVFRDLYVSLGDPVGSEGAWILRVYYKPFISWLWVGAIVMGIGGLIAASDKRYRYKIKQRLIRRQRKERQA
ncbi:MAG: heme lyase CcmF/NrfE family subunit [Hydrogenovibrio sp.]|uniref:heme lyase CcmF/NrfE family subunit n=1 Tax=Hydrogenovibrio sp. TaxID=2065821 RepID=UPI00286FCB41|nr:heme lyase CcmF/NrfE family subunit [Hydrogenovibrio sp.]MDR9499902.1 heme lyase CcmF/NrfE family subunit [Hydrogenovibrio sp.]